jgi:hypothetical protein
MALTPEYSFVGLVNVTLLLCVVGEHREVCIHALATPTARSSTRGEGTSERQGKETTTNPEQTIVADDWLSDDDDDETLQQ